MYGPFIVQKIWQEEKWQVSFGICYWAKHGTSRLVSLSCNIILCYGGYIATVRKNKHCSKAENMIKFFLE